MRIRRADSEPPRATKEDSCYTPVGKRVRLESLTYERFAKPVKGVKAGRTLTQSKGNTYH